MRKKKSSDYTIYSYYTLLRNMPAIQQNINTLHVQSCSYKVCSLIFTNHVLNYTIPFFQKKKKKMFTRLQKHLPELSVLISIVHDELTEGEKSNALRSTKLRDSDQH